MTQNQILRFAILSPAAVLLASCGSAYGGDSTVEAQSTSAAASTEAAWDEMIGPFAVRNMGTFNEPWAAAFAPGTSMLFITEKPGTMKFVDTATGQMGTVTGMPTVDYGGQGGLGDVAFLGSESAATVGSRTIYLSWAEAGDADTRGAVVGRGTLVCAAADACAVEGLSVVWRQGPKVTGRGHYSHRITFAPDESHMFVASGDRQKREPAQDTSNTLGSIVRLNLDGTPAAGNPVAQEIWSYGHRNILGIAFDGAGRLWDIEHGPRGGDELNLVEGGKNYGWPLVSDGNHYDGRTIPNNATRSDLESPKFSWAGDTIAPGDFLFYGGTSFADWQGDAIIASLASKSLIRLEMNGTAPVEAARYDMGERMREVVEGPDGALYVLEDGEDGRLRQLTPG